MGGRVKAGRGVRGVREEREGNLARWEASHELMDEDIEGVELGCKSCSGIRSKAKGMLVASAPEEMREAENITPTRPENTVAAWTTKEGKDRMRFSLLCWLSECCAACVHEGSAFLPSPTCS